PARAALARASMPLNPLRSARYVSQSRCDGTVIYAYVAKTLFCELFYARKCDEWRCFFALQTSSRTIHVSQIGQTGMREHVNW
ncbi:MAG: hypothetical protein R3309_02130, partial [Reinekea sp.]|nr:hypothetical protein [Reinekea sp.]